LKVGDWKLGVWLSLFVLVIGVGRADSVDFATEVYPFLKGNCIACHNASKAKAGLNLESPEMMLKGSESGPVVVPGKSMESLLYLVSAHLEEEFMPPEGNKANARDLTPEELDLLKRWIDEGAKGEAPSTAPQDLKWKSLPDSLTPVYDVDISRDSRFVAFNRGNRVFVYDVAARAVSAELVDGEAAHLDLVQALAFAQDGLLASGGFQTIKLWRQGTNVHAVDLEAMAALPGAGAVVGDVAVAGGADGELVMWNLTTKETKRWKDEAARVVAVSLADGKPLALLETGSVRIGDAVAYKLPMQVSAGVWLPDGRLCVATPEGGVRLFKAEVLEKEWAMGEKVVRMAQLPGQILTATEGGLVKFWNLESGAEVRSIQHGSALTGLAAAGQSVATAGANNEVKIWSAADGKLLHTLRGGETERRKVSEATMARDLANRVFDDAVRTRDEATKVYTETLTKAKATVNIADIAGRRNFELAKRESARDAGALAVAEVDLAMREARKTATEAERVKAEDELNKLVLPVGAVGLSADGKVVAVAFGDSSIVLWSVETGARMDVFSGQSVSSLAFTQGGDVLALGDKSAIVWDVNPEWKLERTIGGLESDLLKGRVSALGFSPDGTRLASGSGEASRSGDLTIWNVADGTAFRTLRDLHSDTINDVSYSRDGEYLATASADRFAKVVETQEWKVLYSLEGHTGHVNSVAWRADGAELATGSADLSVKIWKVATGEQVKTNQGYGKDVTAVAYVGIGNQLVSASADKSLRADNDRFPDVSALLHCAAVGVDGELVVSGDENGVLTGWSARDRKKVFAVEAGE
jgi:WD40 repeat protein